MIMSIWSLVRPALISLVLLTLITGVIYPVAVTVIAQAAFPRQANQPWLLPSRLRHETGRANGDA